MKYIVTVAFCTAAIAANAQTTTKQAVSATQTTSKQITAVAQTAGNLTPATHHATSNNKAAAASVNHGSAAGAFSLKGKLDGLDKGIVYLSYEGAEGKRKSDSAAIQNGQFTFTGKIAEPVMAYFSVNSRRLSSEDPNVANFFLEPAAMTINATYHHVSDAVIKGSKTQQEYAGLQKQQQKLQKRWKVVMDTLHAINSRSNALYQETKAWALSPYSEEYRELTASFIQQHPASFATAYLLRFERGISTDSLKKIYARFPQQVQQSTYGKAMVEEWERRKIGVPGAKAASFAATGIDGQTVSLADHKGKYVLVDFWASWCVPCRKLNPHLKELYARYKDKGFEVIGVSDDDSKPDAWRKAVAQDDLPWKHVLRGMKVIRNGDSITGFDRTNDISDKYNIHSLPTQILIDPAGNIIGRYGDELGEGHEALDKKLENLFP